MLWEVLYTLGQLKLISLVLFGIAKLLLDNEGLYLELSRRQVKQPKTLKKTTSILRVIPGEEKEETKVNTTKEMICTSIASDKIGLIMSSVSLLCSC